MLFCPMCGREWRPLLQLGLVPPVGGKGLVMSTGSQFECSCGCLGLVRYTITGDHAAFSFTMVRCPANQTDMDRCGGFDLDDSSSDIGPVREADPPETWRDNPPLL